jgi:hypothetical protein
VNADHCASAGVVMSGSENKSCNGSTLLLCGAVSKLLALNRRQRDRLTILMMHADRMMVHSSFLVCSDAAKTSFDGACG